MVVACEITLLLLLFLYVTRPATIRQINYVASRETLKASRQNVQHGMMTGPRDSFFVCGIFFECDYECSLTNPSLETIKVRIRGRRGYFTATFKNEVLTEWGRWLFLAETNPLFDAKEIWVYGHLLATVKNAVSTNLVPSMVMMERKAIPH
jgi:hypothetical protein